MRVIFPLQKKPNSNEILYPDDISLFSNTEIKGTDIVADYAGSLSLAKYTSEPKPVEISNIDFWDRFFEAEQESLVSSSNNKIKRFLYELRLRSQTDLRDSVLIGAINAAETAGIIGVGRAAEILETKSSGVAYGKQI